MTRYTITYDHPSSNGNCVVYHEDPVSAFVLFTLTYPDADIKTFVKAPAPPHKTYVEIEHIPEMV